MQPKNSATPLYTSPPARELRAEVWLPLLQDALAQHGRFVFPLRGNSMRPTLPAECEIEVVPLASAPRPGQLIVFAVGDSLIAHRFVARRAGFWIAQGDNRRGPDYPLRPEQVLGTVAAARLGGRRVWPRPGESIWARFWLARYHALQAARSAVRKVIR
jgi:hypothetical protein